MIPIHILFIWFGYLHSKSQDAAVQHGISILRPHVDVLLSSLTELVQHRLQLKGAKGKRVHVASPTELSVMAEVSEWCSDPKVAQQLLQLLVTVLANNKTPSEKRGMVRRVQHIWGLKHQ